MPIVRLVGLLALLLALAACQQETGTLLLFETIDLWSLGTGGIQSESTETSLVIITRPEQAGQLEGRVTPDAQAQLSQLDYEEVFVIALFQGRKPTNGYGVEIERLSRQGNNLIVDARFTNRDPDMPAGEILTSPYHIVAVTKEGIGREELRFVLWANGRSVLQQSYLVP